MRWLEGRGILVLSIVFSLDGSRIAGGGLDREIRLWDVTMFNAVGILCGHTGCIGNLDWEGFPRSIAISTGNGAWNSMTPLEMTKPGASQE